LARVVQEARDYPSIQASRERVNEAAAAVRLAQTAYLPRLDSIAQANRATRNNVFGMLMPQSVIPPISGPPLMSNSMTSVWGSAVGLLATWEPFDFGPSKSPNREGRSGAAEGVGGYETNPIGPAGGNGGRVPDADCGGTNGP
jgi:outer membrane protein TolC